MLLKHLSEESQNTLQQFGCFLRFCEFVLVMMKLLVLTISLSPFHFQWKGKINEIRAIKKLEIKV